MRRFITALVAEENLGFLSDAELEEWEAAIDEYEAKHRLPEFPLREFGRLLTTHAGWGMRIVFVPDDELEQLPSIEVREPAEDRRN